MKKYNTNKVLNLTQYILEEYWQKNLTPLREHLHKNILWIGSMDSEYVHGADAMLSRLNENNEAMPLVFLDQEEFCIVQNEGKTCVVAGRYRAFTKPDSGMLLSEKQRVTFVWEKVKVDGNDELQIKHLHLSNILHIQSEEERFPTRAGKENYEYVQRILAERGHEEVITIKDHDKVSRVINYSEIMYIKSDNNNILIFLSNQENCIKARGKLSDIIKSLPERFIQVSRSYGVNRSFVKSVQGRKLIMMGGEEFQIPAATSARVKKQIFQQKTGGNEDVQTI